MSSSRTERQGQVGDLRQQSKEELRELLLRQEKILSNRRLLQSLPDKGERISEFAEKVRLAIEHHDEEDRRRSLAFAARTELQSKDKQAFSLRNPASPAATPPASQRNGQAEAALGYVAPERETSALSAHVQEKTILDGQHDQFVSRAAAGETMATAAAGASLSSGETKECDLVETLERVRLSQTSCGFSSKSKEPLDSVASDNYFLRKHTPKRPPYVALLEKTESTSHLRKQKFKLNQMSKRSDDLSSGSSSANRSSEGSSPLSVQTRKDRDRKHLDDITAARLPLLHHSPAQLLSLEESATLQKDQTKKQLELQAKLAAQKLSEALKVSMGSSTADGGHMPAYREVYDEGALLSSEDD